MKKIKSVEIQTGLFVLLGFAAIFFLTTQTTNIESYLSDDGYDVTARFEDIGGLTIRAPVTMAGVTIGRVEEITLDPEHLEAIVMLKIDSKYNQIPIDSDASILTSGLLGGQYIGINSGGSFDSLIEGSEIEFTQSAIVLEDLIGKFLLSIGGD
ncbi:MAG: outer membrane lipid asymmetry maintenance protein MlaD [Pseudomonadota bacterium]|nr:outer membrane lipid asymmetry maintenance protein MlaD [Gammaproteobacteria bacterium]MEE2684335.1 outer membrane lipid asymmetry maintenance protein MlaD [Pseudomonadota bacterium]|tara:strand:+ start:2169 stop:2630 length:462 start_codon:yes stop_codon:yes gene_type:complete